MLLADALVEILKTLQVRYVFGVSGANIEHFHDAMYRVGDGKIDAILAKHESAAAFMADGVARTHNTLGVCCATSGGGMMNLAVGIAEAFADGVPLLAIIGQPPTRLEGKGAFQDSSGAKNTVNAVQLFESISKCVVKISSKTDFQQTMLHILTTIFDKRLGPGVLLIPSDLFTMEVDLTDYTSLFQLNNFRQRELNTPNQLYHQINSRLEAANNPLILLGKHVKFSLDANVLEKFSNHYNCSIASSLADVGASLQNNARHIGLVGICGHTDLHQYIEKHVDLFIAIECDLSVMTTFGISNSMNETNCVYIGKDAGLAKCIVNIDNVIEGETNHILNTLMELSPNLSIVKNGRDNTVPKFKRQIVASDHNLIPILNQLQSSVSKVDNIYFDAGDCVATAAHYLKFSDNTKTFIALGMGNMGYAIPAAIGGQLYSSKDQRSIVFVGDGGFLMSGFEIHTAVELKLPILFIIFNNNKHGMCATRQKLFFENRVISATYADVHPAQAVQSLCDAPQLICYRCVTTKQLETALENYAANNEKTFVIEIVVSQDDIPPFIPFQNIRKKD
jgi:acetolactate synthase-1/2/3 large subunit